MLDFYFLLVRVLFLHGPVDSLSVKVADPSQLEFPPRIQTSVHST